MTCLYKFTNMLSHSFESWEKFCHLDLIDTAVVQGNEEAIAITQAPGEGGLNLGVMD